MRVRCRPVRQPVEAAKIGPSPALGRLRLETLEEGRCPGDGERVTIEAVSPRVLENTGASFEFFVCTVDLEGADVGAIGLDNARSFEPMCPDPIPAVAGTELDVGAAQAGVHVSGTRGRGAAGVGRPAARRAGPRAARRHR